MSLHILASLACALLIVNSIAAYAQPVAGPPQSLRSDITIEDVLAVEGDCVRLTYDPTSGMLYYLTLIGDIYRVDPAAATKTRAYTAGDYELHGAVGLTIDAAGTFYVLGNHIEGDYNTATVKRGVMEGGKRVWSMIAYTEPHPLNTFYNHAFNAIEVSPDGKYLYINSGSRTDHGENQHTDGPLAGVREMPLTSKIFRIPLDADSLLLRSNIDSLRAGDYIFADGFRNTFDLAHAPDGELFGAENSSDHDDEEELNWIRKGNHYGFPWRMGTHDNPQRFPGYDPDGDPLLHDSSYARLNGWYHNDPTFPEPPASVVFTDPVLSVGPDGDKFRDPDNGQVRDASDLQLKLGTFTPHRSPLGLVFDTQRRLPGEFNGGGFVLSWSASEDALIAPFADTSSDLLHVSLTKNEIEDRYEARVTRVAHGFTHPIDAVLVGTSLYVIENAANAHLWRVELSKVNTSVDAGERQHPHGIRLSCHPNPLRTSATIEYFVPNACSVRISLYDALGRELRTMAAGHVEAGGHSLRLNAEGLSDGVYFCRLQAGSGVVGASVVIGE
jgi:glucose/arabinose dehydrogenase